jgi:predicted MFS family arabinose efflux permease
VGVLLVFADVYFPLIPVYARDILGVGTSGYGFLLAAQGAGGLVGAFSMVLAGDIRRKALVLAVGAVLWGAGMVAFAFSRNFALSMACVFVMGFVPPWYGTVYRTVLQLAADEDMRERVMSIWAISNQMITLGWLLGGVLATAFGNEAALVIGGVVFAGFNLLALARSKPLTGDCLRLYLGVH